MDNYSRAGSEEYRHSQKNSMIFNLLGRIRQQIIFILIVGVAIPMLIRQYIVFAPFYFTVQLSTIAGGAFAAFLGYFIYRRLLVFPGISAGGYVITSMTMTFGILATTFVIFRIDYSRWQLIGCYAMSMAALLFIYLKVERHRSLIFAYLPGGRNEKLPNISNIVWKPILEYDDALIDVHSIVVDLHYEHDAMWESAITQWVLAGITVYDTQSAIEQLTGRVEIRHISENTLGSLNPNTVILKAKSFFDAIAATILLIIFSPVMIFIGAMIRFDSKGPAIFQQKRTGFRAKTFTVYKFRTMTVDVPGASDNHARHQAMTQDDDVRITRFGRLLRRTRLDELPQLLNIIKGDMSLIGPRPEAIALSTWYEKEIPFYHYRHIIKPGLTGWAQVNQGHVTDVEQIREKLHLDFYYVKNYSVWLDILISLRTIAIMITGHGAR